MIGAAFKPDTPRAVPVLGELRILPIAAFAGFDIGEIEIGRPEPRPVNIALVMGYIDALHSIAQRIGERALPEYEHGAEKGKRSGDEKACFHRACI